MIIKGNSLEDQKSITESIKNQEATKIENPILKRCAEKNADPLKNVHEAYDRMYHRHSRS